MSLIMELEEKSAMKTQKVSENERFINVNELLEQNKVIFPIVFLRCL